MYEPKVYCKCSMCGEDIMFDDVMYTFQGIPGMEHVCEACVEAAEGYAPSDFEEDVDE